MSPKADPNPHPVYSLVLADVVDPENRTVSTCVMSLPRESGGPAQPVGHPNMSLYYIPSEAIGVVGDAMASCDAFIGGKF